MSGLVNKVKEAVKPNKEHHEAGHSTHTTEGTHHSRPAEGIASHESAVPRTTATETHNTSGLGGTSHHDPMTGTTGHGHGKHNEPFNETGLGTSAAHAPGGATAGTHTGTHAGGVGGLGERGTHTGTHATETAGLGSTGFGETGTRSGVSGYDDPAGVHGPHSSRAGNVADPRVDSDRDNRGTVGTGGMGATSGLHGTGTGTGTSGLHSTGTAAGSGVGTGVGTGSHTRTTGYDDPAGSHGPHASRAGNVADPRVDSDRDNRGTGTYEGTTHTSGGAVGGLGTPAGQGPAPGTAGPHKSDMLNKADPRVDSNMDGSKTFGGDKTYQS